MVEIPAECYHERDHLGEVLVCKEGGRRVVFTKPKDMAADKIRVDGCVLKEGKACDYLVIDWKRRRHFVELKGRHDEAALHQIIATIPSFIEDSGEEFWCFIAWTGCSPKARPGVQNLKSKIKRSWPKARIVIRTGECEHSLE